MPVIACCETYKFTEAILLDSFMKNEIGKLYDAAALQRILTKRLAPNDISTDSGEIETGANLQSLSPLYDLTPHFNLTAVVAEVGLIPSTAVPTVIARILGSV